MTAMLALNDTDGSPCLVKYSLGEAEYFSFVKHKLFVNFDDKSARNLGL